MQLRTKKAGIARLLLAGAIALSAPAGCFALGLGLEPPARRFYFPTALVTSPGGRVLYVVSSDFDIQYTGGTVQALDLVAMRACVDRLRDSLNGGASAGSACNEAGFDPSDPDADGDKLNDDPVSVPGPCIPLDTERSIVCEPAGAEPVVGPLVRSSRVIGAFASSAALVRDPDPAGTEARLFVTVRGDPSVTFFRTIDDLRFEPSGNQEADDSAVFRLDCDAETDPPGAMVGGRCGTLALIGDSRFDSSRLLPLPVEPVSIAASSDGGSLVVLHQTTAAASLLINKWGANALPTLEHTLIGLSDGPSEIAAIPTPEYVARVLKQQEEAAAAGTPVASPLQSRPAFLATYRASRGVDILRRYDDTGTLGRHFLQRVAVSLVATNSDGSDSRGIAVDDSERRACEAACACGATCGEAGLACLRGCLDVPLNVFIANRGPGSLVFGKLETSVIESDGVVTATTDSLALNDMVPLPAGPSRVIVGDVLDEHGQRSPRVFAVSFDSRYVVIYDPRLRRVEATVQAGRGPQALAVDVVPDEGGMPGHAYLYVAHFTDSYVGVVDLDTRHARTYGSMFASVGQPTPPKESN